MWQGRFKCLQHQDLPRHAQQRAHIFQIRLSSRGARRSFSRNAVDYRTAAPPVKFDHSGTADEVRSYFTKLGWERSWIDGITERIIKVEFKTSTAQVQEIVELLEGLGLPTHWVCNLIARAPGMLGRDPKSQIKPVLDYIQSRGVSGEAFLRLLRDYPRLLTFNVSSNGQCLELGDARAEVNVAEDEYRGRVANVSYWRTGAAFETAPVSPIRPVSS